MRAESAVRLALHGVQLVIESDAAAFTRYVRAVMAPQLSTGSEPPAIHSRLQWVDAPPAGSLQNAFGVTQWDRRPDRDLYLAGKTAYWLRIDEFPDLHLCMTWDQGTLRIVGRYYFQLGRERRLERLRRWRYRRSLGRLRAHRFSTLLYYLVYYPILWRLSRFEDWHVLHAAAVANGENAVMISGMPGCGKSTMAVAMLGDRDCCMLSDNLLLHNGTSVLACPEALLLDHAGLARAGRGADRLRPTGERRVYLRDAYRPDRTELRPLPPLVCFQVGRARQTRLLPLDKKEALAWWAADNIAAKEVRRLDVMGAVLDLVAGTRAPDASLARQSLVEHLYSYSLWVGQGAELPGVIDETLRPIIDSARRGTHGRAGRR